MSTMQICEIKYVCISCLQMHNPNNADVFYDEMFGYKKKITGVTKQKASFR